MTDQEKTREQLLQELADVRAQLSRAEERNKELVTSCNDLEQTLELVDLAAEALGVGIWRYDLKTNELSVNEGWVDHLGYTLGEVASLEYPWSDLVDEDDQEMLSSEFHKFVEGEQERFVSEYRVRCKDGNYIWVVGGCWATKIGQDAKPERIMIMELDENAGRNLELCGEGIRRVFDSMRGPKPDLAVIAYDLDESGASVELDSERATLCRALASCYELQKELTEFHFYVKDDASRYVYVSPEMVEYFGMDSSYFIGRTDDEVFGTKAEQIDRFKAVKFKAVKITKVLYKGLRGAKPIMAYEWIL